MDPISQAVIGAIASASFAKPAELRRAAGIGALAGQAIGGDTEATLIGAGVGALAGYAIGNEQDKK